MICKVPTNPTHSVTPWFYDSMVLCFCGHSWLSWQPVLLGTMSLLTEGRPCSVTHPRRGLEQVYR